MPILQQKNNDDLKHKGDDPNVTDPQENEKDGNVFGKAFDALFGDSQGDHSVSQDEPISPAKNEGEQVNPDELKNVDIDLDKKTNAV